MIQDSRLKLNNRSTSHKNIAKNHLQQCHMHTTITYIIDIMPMSQSKSDLNCEAQNSYSSPLTLNTCSQEIYGSSYTLPNFKINFPTVLLN